MARYQKNYKGNLVRYRLELDNRKTHDSTTNTDCYLERQKTAIFTDIIPTASRQYEACLELSVFVII